MVLVYMLTWLGYIDGIHVTIYTSTMDPMGILLVDFIATSNPQKDADQLDTWKFSEKTIIEQLHTAEIVRHHFGVCNSFIVVTCSN